MPSASVIAAGAPTRAPSAPSGGTPPAPARVGGAAPRSSGRATPVDSVSLSPRAEGASTERPPDVRMRLPAAPEFNGMAVNFSDARPSQATAVSSREAPASAAARDAFTTPDAAAPGETREVASAPREAADADRTEAPETPAREVDMGRNDARRMSEAEVRTLRIQERQVRRTQFVKAAVGGATVTGASYQFDIGPDGHRYIVGGDVALDVNPVEGDPRATIHKMQRVRAAAVISHTPTRNDRNATFASVRTEGSARIQLAKMVAFQSSAPRIPGRLVDESA